MFFLNLYFRSEANSIFFEMNKNFLHLEASRLVFHRI